MTWYDINNGHAWWWSRWCSLFPIFSCLCTRALWYSSHCVEQKWLISLCFIDFISLGMPLWSCCMVPTMVNFWSMLHSVSETEVKYIPFRYCTPQLNWIFKLSWQGTLCTHLYQLRSIWKSHQSLLLVSRNIAVYNMCTILRNRANYSKVNHTLQASLGCISWSLLLHSMAIVFHQLWAIEMENGTSHFVHCSIWTVPIGRQTYPLSIGCYM